MVKQDFFQGYLGEPLTVTVCLTDCDNVPLDLTGATVTWDVVDYYGGTTIFTVNTVSDPTKIVISDPPNGIVDITIDGADTTGIARNCSNFTIKVEFENGEVEILFNGWQLYLFNR